MKYRKRRIYKAFVAILVYSLGLIGVLSRGTISAIAQQLPDLDPVEPRPLPLPNAPPNPDFTSPTLDQPELPEQCQAAIVVEDIQLITEHPVLSADALERLNQEYITQDAQSCAGLIQLAFRVAELYDKEGFSITNAITEIPAATQAAGRGVVNVVITETTIDEIHIQGLQRLQAGYVRSRLPISTPLNIPELQEALQLLALDPILANIKAELRTDIQPGQSLLIIEAKETKTLNPQFTLNNNRASSVGSHEQRLGFQTYNATGLGDRLTVGFTRSEGSSGLDLNYSLPLNAQNGTLSFAHNRSHSRIIEDPFSILDIESTSSTSELSIRQPLKRRIYDRQGLFEELAVGAGLAVRNGQTSLLDIPFPLSAGAESDGTTKTTVLRLFQDYTRQSATEVLALRSQFNIGLDALDSTINEQIAGVEFIPDSRFFSWQGQMQWLKILERNTLWLVSGNIQLADQGLFGSEQFSSGGATSVRGYRRDILSSDNGLEFSTELWLPILELRDRSVVQIVPFFGYSLGWNSSNRTEPDPNQLAAMGLGLRWAKDSFTMRLDWGIPLIAVEEEKDNLQENGLYFSVEWLGF
ncbi:MAG: ShlB/FhaC/HecB family hemolysin secretion/activation protein [Spirulina sp. SIO3F2]|nr:ShlB/FhaC/HecB family hemolysin secretion/activation protein [Spirulina sp. SIO3F2]